MGNIGVFLDRDGTINEEIDFLTSPGDISIIPRSPEAIATLNTLGYKTIVVTNQSGVARGLLTEEELNVINDEIRRKLESRGARLDRIYYCPHHPTEGSGRYRTTCDCRKPGTGMMERAVRELGVDLKRSFVVGDRITDIEMANRAGARAILVLTGYGRNDLERCERDGIVLDHVADDLFDAVRFISSSPPAAGRFS